MPHPDDEGGTKTEQLEAVIARFLTAVESGQTPDQNQLLERNPDIADELRVFFDNDDRVRTAIGQDAKETGCSAEFRQSPMPGLHWDHETLPPNGLKPVADSIETSRVFGDYQLLHEVSRGGMGVVFKARQTSLNRTVALKMILSGDLASDEEVRRFHSEAEAAAGLSHPGIVPIYDVGYHQGRHYFSMQFIEGTTLAERLADGPLSGAEAAMWTQKIAEAVAYAHSQGVVHRDLKPANVLINEHGEPMITDFGLAKNLNADSHPTATGQILGTPAFMAPEQATGDREAATEMVDIYSLGAILYALCTGHAPFEATNQVDILLQVIDREPLLPSSLHRGLPKALEQICLRCLEKRATLRYQSAAALAADLRRFQLGEPIEARSADYWQRLRRWAGREPALVSHLAGICAVFLIECAAFTVLNSDVSYFVAHISVLALWSVVSFLLQKMLNISSWATTARFTWAAADLLFYSAVLYMAEPPRGPLLIGYPLLVAASGLFSRVRLVVFTTGVSLVAFTTLMLMTPEEPKKPHFCFIFAAVLVVLGSIVAAQVRKLRALSRYYERTT